MHALIRLVPVAVVALAFRSLRTMAATSCCSSGSGVSGGAGALASSGAGAAARATSCVI
jgi:hypothetical protein